MSKYTPLWEWISKNGTECFSMAFDEIERIAGVNLDHSFLRYKKELERYGYIVEKISLMEKTVKFKRYNGTKVSK